MRCVSCGTTPEDIVGAPDAADHFIPVGDEGEIRCATCIAWQIRSGGKDTSWLVGILVDLNRKRLTAPGRYWPV